MLARVLIVVLAIAACGEPARAAIEFDDDRTPSDDSVQFEAEGFRFAVPRQSVNGDESTATTTLQFARPEVDFEVLARYDHRQGFVLARRPESLSLFFRQKGVWISFATHGSSYSSLDHYLGSVASDCRPADGDGRVRMLPGFDLERAVICENTTYFRARHVLGWKDDALIVAKCKVGEPGSERPCSFDFVIPDRISIHFLADRTTFSTGKHLFQHARALVCRLHETAANDRRMTFCR